MGSWELNPSLIFGAAIGDLLASRSPGWRRFSTLSVIPSYLSVGMMPSYPLWAFIQLNCPNFSPSFASFILSLKLQQQMWQVMYASLKLLAQAPGDNDGRFLFGSQLNGFKNGEVIQKFWKWDQTRSSVCTGWLLITQRSTKNKQSWTNETGS